MKKFILCLLVSILMFNLIGCTFKIQDKEFTIGKKDIKTEEDIGSHYVDGKWYTRDEVEWKQMHPDKEISYIENYDTRSKSEYFVLNMMECSYVEIRLPGDYLYINSGTEIKSADGAIKVNIYKGEVGSDIEVSNEVLFSKDVKYTEDGGRILHSIVKNLSNDYTIVAQVGSNSNDWSFMRDSIINTDIEPVYISDSITYQLGRPNYNTDVIQSVFPTDEYAQVPTVFKEGYITVLNSAYDFDENMDCVLTWLSTVSDGTNITVYKDAANETLFGETETGYSVSLFKNNNQYFFITYGYGEEAKANNIMMLNKQE